MLPRPSPAEFIIVYTGEVVSDILDKLGVYIEHGGRNYYGSH